MKWEEAISDEERLAIVIKEGRKFEDVHIPSEYDAAVCYLVLRTRLEERIRARQNDKAI